MDLNLVLLGGQLGIDPELREHHSGSRLARYQVIVRSEEPRRRVDVVPVVLWNPAGSDLDYSRGDTVWVLGNVQRRFCASDDGRRSSVEVIASRIEHRADLEPPDMTPHAARREAAP